ncbi:hypothetical protein BJX62DRAFT_231059 [Aspergillus germanicus]
MELLPQSTKTALQRQFEVLAELLSPVDTGLSKILKDLGGLFEADAKGTILYLNKALKGLPRTRNKPSLTSSIVATSNDAVQRFFGSYDGLGEDEIPQLVELLKTIERNQDKVKEIRRTYAKYSDSPDKFWTSFSDGQTGDNIKQIVSAIDHHSSSSPLARRLLCRRLAAEVNSKAQELQNQRLVLKPGTSYRDLAIRLSLEENWEKHKTKLQEGERWSCLDPGVLAAIKGTNWKSWARTSPVGIRAINEYLKKDPVTTIYQEMSTTMQEIQDSFGSTVHNRITPTPSLTHSDSQLVHLGPPISACSLSGDREARTKRRRICWGSGRDSRIGHRRGGCKRMLEARERTTGSIPSLQEAGGPIDSSSGMVFPPLEPPLTRRVEETDFPQTATQTVIMERSDAVQNTLDRSPQNFFESSQSSQPSFDTRNNHSLLWDQDFLGTDALFPNVAGDARYWDQDYFTEANNYDTAQARMPYWDFSLN